MLIKKKKKYTTQNAIVMNDQLKNTEKTRRIRIYFNFILFLKISDNAYKTRAGFYLFSL